MPLSSLYYLHVYGCHAAYACGGWFLNEHQLIVFPDWLGWGIISGLFDINHINPCILIYGTGGIIYAHGQKSLL